MNVRVATVVLMLMSVLFSTRAFGQSCPNVGSVPDPDVGGAYLVTSDGTCTLASGGYIKKQNTGTDAAKYKVHFVATVTGGCQARVAQCSPLPCQCIDSTYYVRNLGTSQVQRNGAVLGNVAVLNSTVQHYDTFVPTGTGQQGWSWKPTTEGKFTYTSTIRTNATVCGLTPTESAGTPFVANVVKCRPYYQTDPTDPTETIRLPQGPILIHVPGGQSDLVSAANAVAADYTSGLAGTGITVTRTDTPCSGGNCVNVITGDTGPACARWLGEWNSQGVITESTVIYPTNHGYASSTVRRYMAHELGHLLGLDDSEQADCFASSSIMSSGDPCGTEYTGDALSPQPSDFLPIANSVYGTLPRTVCGF
jgi:hypothetical protein